MRTRITWSLVALASVGAAVHALDACVPADTRPTPGALTLTVSPSPAVQHGVVTADGWSVTFDRVLIALGRASFGDTCTTYTEADYDRVLDVTSLTDQKLGILHGIGTCDLRFRVAPPSADAVLGAGVSEADKTTMRTPGGDAYVPLDGISVDVAGTATRGATTKRLHLTFRPSIRYQKCALAPDAAAVDLASSADVTFDLRIEAEALLRDDVDASAALRFDPFAAADTDADGVITLDELRGVPLTSVRDGGAFEAGTYEDDDAGVVHAGPPILVETFADYLYVVLLPTLPRFRDTGACTPSARRRAD